MPDITMCVNTLCPNAGHCYRVQAKPCEYSQSMANFQYTVSNLRMGVECDNYMEMREVYRCTSCDTPSIEGDICMRCHEEA